MKYKVIESVTHPYGPDILQTIIPAGTIINLEPVEEVKVKAFVPEQGECFFYLAKDLFIKIALEIIDVEPYDMLLKFKFRTKEDAQIAQAKVIELFNSFK